MFGTDSPAFSNRHHRGLFHGKTHSQRKKRVFSMKYRIETQKPNIFKKTLRSDILEADFKLWISTKARKCIMKAGSLDNYLLNTKPERIGSKFGLHLRSLIQEKRKNPECFKLDYIPGTSPAKRTRKTKAWEYRRMPAVYVPAHIRATTDLSEFYEKAPQEMSRYELKELERVLMMTEEEAARESERLA